MPPPGCPGSGLSSIKPVQWKTQNSIIIMVKDVTTPDEKPGVDMAGAEHAHSIRRDSGKHSYHIPFVHKSKHDPEWDGSNVDFSHIDTKKVLRKMDIRLIPNLALLYLLSFLDRGNIGNAKIQGLTEDLRMTGVLDCVFLHIL
jgi:hypothetical protein